MSKIFLVSATLTCLLVGCTKEPTIQAGTIELAKTAAPSRCDELRAGENPFDGNEKSTKEVQAELNECGLGYIASDSKKMLKLMINSTFE